MLLDSINISRDRSCSDCSVVRDGFRGGDGGASRARQHVVVTIELGFQAVRRYDRRWAAEGRVAIEGGGGGGGSEDWSWSDERGRQCHASWSHVPTNIQLAK
jgi:hypothetical protein